MQTNLCFKKEIVTLVWYSVTLSINIDSLWICMIALLCWLSNVNPTLLKVDSKLFNIKMHFLSIFNKTSLKSALHSRWNPLKQGNSMAVGIDKFTWLELADYEKKINFVYYKMASSNQVRQEIICLIVHPLWL